MSKLTYEEMEQMMKPGLRVVRGRDWNMSDQDGNGPGTVLSQNLTLSHLWEVKWDKTDERCWHFMGTNSMGEKNIDLKSLTFLLLHLRKLSEVSSLWPRTPMT